MIGPSISAGCSRGSASGKRLWLGLALCLPPRAPGHDGGGRGDDDAGPYQSPMEDGMQQFHEWYRREMGWQPTGA